MSSTPVGLVCHKNVLLAADVSGNIKYHLESVGFKPIYVELFNL